MNLKSTLSKLSKLFAGLLLLTVSTAEAAVYCSPTFSNGCSGWRNQAITLGSINWTAGTCTTSDFTTTSTTLNTGVAYPMSVTNGAYCGCSVWIDINQDQNFDSTENFYYQYTATASGTNTYNFNITIPASVPVGTYRMRLVAGWGSDGYLSTNTNGYGPCGSYMYGNFDDFSIDVAGPVGISPVNGNALSFLKVSPNPASASVTVDVNGLIGHDANLRLTDITGKLLQSRSVVNEKEVFDISDLAKGIYILRYTDGLRNESIRLVK